MGSGHESDTPVPFLPRLAPVPPFTSRLPDVVAAMRVARSPPLPAETPAVISAAAPAAYCCSPGGCPRYLIASFEVHRRTALALNTLYGVRVAIAILAYALMARAFGTSPEMDAFWVAATPVLVVLNLVEAAGVGATVTFIASLDAEPGPRRSSEIAGFLAVALAILTAVAAVIWLLADDAVALLGPGLPATGRQQAAGMIRLMSIALVLGPWTLLCQGLLQGAQHFFSAALVVALPHVLLLAALLLVVSDVQQLALFFVAGHVLAAGAAALTVWRLFAVASLRPSFTRLAEVTGQFLPMTLAAILLQAIWIGERSLASTLEAGSVSALSYALRIVTVLGGLVAAGFEATVMTAVAERHARGRHTELRDELRRALALVAALAVIPGLCLVLAGDWIVRVLLRGGAFGAESAALTATVLLGYAGVYVYSSIGRVLIPAAVGRRRARTAIVASLAALLSYMAWATWLTAQYGILGLAVAASLSFCLATIVYAADAARR